MAELKEIINGYVQNAHEALDEISNYSQKQVDNICQAMVEAALAHKEELANLAVEETKRGKVQDKVEKNIFASKIVWDSIRKEKTVGIINEDEEKGLVEIAEPIGVIVGITPVTNPTSTVIFKSLIALKTRNTIIFAFHPQAQQASKRAAEILQEAIVTAGGPRNAIQWIEEPSLDATNTLINHKDIQTILATGGPGMVKAAYSSGKPALGVGPGNGPSYIEKTADLTQAVKDIVASKTFDNGMICASENSVVVDQEVYDEVKKKFEDLHCYFLTDEEIKKFEEHFIDPKRGTVAGPIAGKSAVEIAKLCGVKVPEDTQVIIAQYQGVGPKYPLSAEKLSPVFTLYRADSQKEAFEICSALVNYGGRGHTAGIHTTDKEIVKKFSFAMSACRILVNTPAAMGGIGGMYNSLMPSLTLGAGSYGANSISHNVSAKDLLNIKTIAYRNK